MGNPFFRFYFFVAPDLEPFPQPFATALFSFLYHLASYESGGEALVSCGMMESLLKVINWYGEGQEHITVGGTLILYKGIRTDFSSRTLTFCFYFLLNE